jgi:hypothetical protein
MANGLSEKLIRITLDDDGTPVPDQETAEVRKDNQKVRWCADFEFEIAIDGYDDVTYGSGGTDCRFRCTTGTFGEIKRYKYSIVANGKENDPFLDVKP